MLCIKKLRRSNMASELSLIQAAIRVLNEEKKPLNIYDLYKKVIKVAYLKDDIDDDTINKFYTDLVTSAHFIYTGDNEWDLKENHKIELWDKDGSYYKEYTEVEVPKAMKEKEPKKAKPTKSKAKPEKVVKPEKVEEEVVEPTVIKEEDKIVPEVAIVSEESIEEEIVEDYEEEVFEDYEDDFDEDKYNEYMDKYEDRYDD